MLKIIDLIYVQNHFFNAVLVILIDYYSIAISITNFSKATRSTLICFSEITCNDLNHLALQALAQFELTGVAAALNHSIAIGFSQNHENMS